MGRAEIVQVPSCECVYVEVAESSIYGWVAGIYHREMSQLYNRAGLRLSIFSRKVYRIRTSRNSDSCAMVTPLQTVSVRSRCCIPMGSGRSEQSLRSEYRSL